LTDPVSFTENIKAEAQRLGFALVGVTTPAPPPHVPNFERWLAEGRQAGMGYLASERSRARRANPRAILPEARSVVCLATPYPNPGAIPFSPLPDQPPTGLVASYAWGSDYHSVLEPRLRALVEWAQRESGSPILHRVYSDTGPVLERDLAQRAGIGWIGKNTCLIDPRRGSYFLLSEILLELELEPDPPFSADQCGSCRRCIDACPTGCILPDRTIDAGRCISYLTIENKGDIPTDLRAPVGGWIFGCDICQMVCPWNIRFADQDPDPGLAPRAEIPTPNLLEEIHLGQDEFRDKFRDSPIRRAKRSGYLRNIAVALGNSADARAVPQLEHVLFNEIDALVRGHAAWALGEIGGRQARRALEKALAYEPDPGVREEIVNALQ